MCKQTRTTVAGKGVSKRTGRNANRGFTLVELLVVVAIIALLMSVLMPALRRVKMQAEEAKCRSNLRQVGITIFMYLQEAEFKLPNFYVIPPRNDSKCNKHLWTHSDGTRYNSDEDESYWGTAYNEYVKDVDIFGCPSMRQFAEILAKDVLPGYPGGKEAIQKAAFGLNAYLTNINTNSVKTQAEVVVCTDHIEPRDEQAHEANHGDTFCIGNDTDKKNLTHYREGSATGARMLYYRGIFRHNVRKGDMYETGGRANVLYLDGAANSVEEFTGKGLSDDDVKRWNRFYDPRGTANGGWLVIE